MRFRFCLLLLLAPLVGHAAGRASAAIDVFLDFDSMWTLNLAQSAMQAGTPMFDATEISQIEATILDEFALAFAPFDINITTTDPGGQRERIHYGATTGLSNVLGQSPVNFLNTSSTTASVFAANFGFIIESDEPRDVQIAELAIALSGTGIHELGHSFGMRHHAAYGNITPAQFGDTNGAQNTSFMATGSTGLTEEQREQRREFSRWSTVMMEAAINLTPNPPPLVIENPDAGGNAGSAMLLNTTPLSVSQTDAALVFGELTEESDIDLFAFEVQNPVLLTAEIYAQGFFSFPDDFDSQLRVYDVDGLTILGENDDVLFDPTTFDSGTMHETDSMLLNVLLPSAGTYFIEVSSNGVVTDPDGGGFYELLFATAQVPEPATGLLVALGALALLGFRPKQARRS